MIWDIWEPSRKLPQFPKCSMGLIHGEQLAVIITAVILFFICISIHETAKVIHMLLFSWMKLSWAWCYSKVVLMFSFTWRLYHISQFLLLTLHHYGNHPHQQHCHYHDCCHCQLHHLAYLLCICNESTNTAIHSFIERKQEALDCGLQAVGIFFDLTKPYDVLNHDILLEKFISYGVRGNKNSKSKSYMTDRRQFVKINQSYHIHYRRINIFPLKRY